MRCGWHNTLRRHLHHPGLTLAWASAVIICCDGPTGGIKKEKKVLDISPFLETNFEITLYMYTHRFTVLGLMAINYISGKYVYLKGIKNKFTRIRYDYINHILIAYLYVFSMRKLWLLQSRCSINICWLNLYLWQAYNCVRKRKSQWYITHIPCNKFKLDEHVKQLGQQCDNPMHMVPI